MILNIIVAFKITENWQKCPWDQSIFNWIQGSGLHSWQILIVCQKCRRDPFVFILSVKGFFSVASPASFLPSVPVCLSSVSDPCPYPSCLCLPLHTSFSRCPSSSRREGAAASSVLSLRTFMSIPVWPTTRISRRCGRSAAFALVGNDAIISICYSIVPHKLFPSKVQ